MIRVAQFFKHFYVYIILIIFYVPLLVGTIFSFNSNPDKGGFLTTWDTFSTEQWTTIFNDNRDIALINSIILAISVSIIVITISLISVYAIYRQKNKLIKHSLTGTANIPLINPDNITAIGLVLVFAVFFGVIASDAEGLWRTIIGHTIMALPYGIMLMLPRSEKFNNNLFEASQDLGYSKIKSWFKTYFVFMIPPIIMVALVSSFLSFDDFIITRTVSNTSTLGLKLYEGVFEPWSLVLGSILLLITIFGNIVYIIVKLKRKIPFNNKISKNKHRPVNNNMAISKKSDVLEVNNEENL